MDTQEAPAESLPGSKISDLIAAAQELRKPFVSLEFFPPRTVAGVVNLRERIQRLKRVAPFFIDFTWGAGGNTADLTLDLVLEAKLEHGLEPNMHLTCTNMPVLKIDNALQACREHGVRNIVALRGDPPAGENQWLASEGGFKCALDLVHYIRQQHGDFFCVSVAGYPEGHPDRIRQRKGGLDALSEAERARCSVSPGTGEVYVCSDKDFEVELAYLKAKCEAGADVIITQMFFDASVYGRFVAECRRVGITQPIVPGIMPINAYGGFQRMTSFCRTRVPPNLLARIEVNKDNEAAIKEIGLDYGEQMCRELLQLGAPGLHFYTLNLEKVTVGILRRMGLAGDYDEPPTEDTAQMLDMIKSG
ncbi:methylenetetrahydrofolate reductase [Tribonema minus]|uniref:Methylenetetrahydrofolate reductase n=1 Tax=Tribonema minus TaxID=303371 RepID=A0A836CIM9_9STRA|nr:methylenetetrahydrofolate reductase [Tribonema minus]